MTSDRLSTYSFEGGKRDVSDELSTGRRDGKTNSLVLDGVLFTSCCLEDILEDFVEAELAEALGSISDQSGEPSLEKSVLRSAVPSRISCPLSAAFGESS